MKLLCTDVTCDAAIHVFPFHGRAAHTDFCASALSYGVLTSQKGVKCELCTWGERASEHRARSSASTVLRLQRFTAYEIP